MTTNRDNTSSFVPAPLYLRLRQPARVGPDIQRVVSDSPEDLAERVSVAWRKLMPLSQHGRAHLQGMYLDTKTPHRPYPEWYTIAILEPPFDEPRIEEFVRQHRELIWHNAVKLLHGNTLVICVKWGMGDK